MSRVRSVLLAPARTARTTATSIVSVAGEGLIRRYSVLVTTPGDGRGTWHTITAANLGAALRDARTRDFWETASVAYERDQAQISAIECLGLVGH